MCRSEKRKVRESKCKAPAARERRGRLRVASFAFCILNLALSASAAQTMRVDYYHSGNDKQESFSLDRIVIEPLPWPGNPKRPLDTTNSGKYLFEVIDKATGSPLYSRGFSSIYGDRKSVV